MIKQPVVIAISAGAEWRVVQNFYPDVDTQPSPFGKWFQTECAGIPVIFFHEGWGKVAAAAATQYAISRWLPGTLINLGTCGGFAGSIERGEILLVERTVMYDIIEQMNPDPEPAIRHYSIDLNLDWLRKPYPQVVRRSLLVSADRDICVPDIPMLVEKYGAVAADWESGAIAWVARQNNVRCLILRGVSDLVGEPGGEAYGNIQVFHEGTRLIMEALLGSLPSWLAALEQE